MRILVFHSWGIGDLVMATPMLKTLALNGYEVDLVLTNHINRSIVKEAKFIKNIFVINKITDFLRFYKKYDYFIVTAGTNPLKAKLLNLMIGAKNVISTFQKKDIHRLELNLEMVKPFCKEIAKQPYVYVPKSDSFQPYIVQNRKNIGFAVGSGYKQKFKRWDIEKFIDLIGKFDANILVFIGPDEDDLYDRLKDIEWIKIIKESLEDSVKIISKLDLLIGNDNGLMHIGKAVGVKTFTIFGMTDEKEVGSYDRDKNFDIYIDIDCRPCFHTKYKPIKCRNFKCFDNMSIEYVYQKIERAL